MINVKTQDDELVIEGEVKADDIYPGFCCQGYDYEVCFIFPNDNPNYTSIWGVCLNPDCPQTTGEIEDYWRGLSENLLEDFAEKLAKEGQK